MSGHSKWHRIKHQKQTADVNRGKEFTRLASQIKQATFEGKDPKTNSALAEAISRAKNANMPMSKIKNLLKSPESNHQENITYEAYGPNGVAILIIAQTDNRCRTVSEIRHLLVKHNSTLAETGSVLWKFHSVSIITIKSPDQKMADEIQLALIDAGATDIKFKDETAKIISPLSNKNSIINILKSYQLKPQKISQEYIPSQKSTVNENNKNNFLGLIKDLNNHPNIEHVYTDADNL